MRLHFRWLCNLLDQAFPFPTTVVFSMSPKLKVKNVPSFNYRGFCCWETEWWKREWDKQKNMKRKSVLFWSRVTAPGDKNTHVEIQCTGSTDAINNNIIQGEGEGLYSSVHTSAAASKTPSLIWFPVPKVLSPPFQNGSLVCNIISNTLGYRLILLWCHHSRKSAGMRPAPLWLAPLCLGGSRPRSTFLLIANVRATDDPGFMLDKLSLCFSKI